MIILGIESSCDETAAAIIKVTGGRFNIMSNIVSSQINIHQKYGGVVPEVAARNHVQNIIPVINQALNQAKIKPSQLDRLAVTVGPGLITSLMVGIETAKTLAYAWNKPIVPVNHLKAHLYANWLNNQKLIFPAIALIVSGGHTELVLMKNATHFKKIGQTLDDAAGEAFDKTAQLLKIGYPGGPIISKLAATGDPQAFKFPRPMINDHNFNFSFSGLKTSILYTVQKIKRLDASTIADLSASFQQAVVDVLTAKTIRAAQIHRAKSILLSGGVAANQSLRNQLQTAAKADRLKFLMPDFKFCTDNATMIAAGGYFGKPTAYHKLTVKPNLEI
ncbi:MAG: tRNA (adenosine(37)-N6)-threonylcarbamoyltransferase complex transferase subunit TsaD [Patescibacteria group bacterium]|jgi:N6-L-threonylcarbamoyladenine synthase|nr:tRNA (adenosine(37)-N6)-threonylcarbamoyltransferase complex transferase subunit TsaD [Patescibacteria group bacterium]